MGQQAGCVRQVKNPLRAIEVWLDGESAYFEMWL